MTRNWRSACCSDCVELDPQRAELHQHLAQTLQVLGEPEKALAEIDLALGLEPKSAASLSLKAQLLCGTKQYEQALAYLEQATVQLPDDESLLTTTAIPCSNSGATPKHNAIWQTPRSACNPPRCTPLRRAMAVRTGDTAAAAAAYTQYAKLDPATAARDTGYLSFMLAGQNSATAIELALAALSTADPEDTSADPARAVRQLHHG